MEPDRRRQLLLAALVVVLAVILGYRFWPSADVSTSAVSMAPRSARPGQASGTVTAPDVHIAALNAARPTPDDADRNLFQFKAKPIAPPPRPVAPPVQIAPAPIGPPPPPAIPTIPLKYIGYIETASGEKIASFTDASSDSPVQAIEGQTVLGRYRLLRIGVESVELSNIDGSGRQTIRQTGQ